MLSTKNSHVVISLGANCNNALIMRSLHLRDESLPFDWTWNLHDGIRSVTKIIEDGFDQFQDQSAFIISEHYAFDKPVTLFKEYPLIFHPHMNPTKNKQDLQKMKRRFNRLERHFIDDTSIAILYTEILEKFESGKFISDLVAYSTRLINDINSFKQALEKTYGSKEIVFHLFIQSDKDKRLELEKILKRQLHEQEHFSYTFTWVPQRDEQNIWKHLHWFFIYSFNVLTIVDFPITKKMKAIGYLFLEVGYKYRSFMKKK